MSAAGGDATFSESKIEPLVSNIKSGEPPADSSGGAAGTDSNIGRTRIDPMKGAGQSQSTAPHTDDQGSIGRDAVIAGVMIDPLVAQAEAVSAAQAGGLQDEEIGAARMEPMGAVRDEVMQA